VIGVLVAAPSPRARADLARRLDRFPGLRAATASPDLGLVDEVRAQAPDVLLLEATTTGLTVILEALALLPRAPAVVLLADDGRAALDGERLRPGVLAVLPRHATPGELAAAVESAAAGLLVLHRDLAGDLAWRPGGARAAQASDQPLTPREIEVLGLLADGLANKPIAVRLGITDHTVKAHVAAILEKLGAQSRAEAVAIGIRRGLILV
jgi:DNA-binding NarL/FixJ family response regulator